ncbi:MAG: hypothetical protein QG567_1405 [Campylobacterota bacterium]|nr:hypothetical protein [Campylobacterota bacterium]MDQ1340248.1 hypothetical protein [Campylobacterota bacterium]
MKKTLTGSKLSTNLQVSAEEQRVEYFKNGIGSTSDKLNSFARFKSRQNFAKDLCYYELFKATQGILGSIVECGVYYGHGLMSYANISAALEPYNYQSKVIGFDTFSGACGESNKDKHNYIELKDGDYKAESYSDLLRAIEIFNLDRPLNHLPKVELVQGDMLSTIPAYMQNNPQTIIRILNLTVNLYEPTKIALELLYPKIPKGGIVMINALNYVSGATLALDEVVGINNIELKTFDFYPNITYFIKS